jgi:hypothetical protein
MAKEPKEQRPTDRTPKGYGVPVPHRGEFFANLKKVAKPDRRDLGSASGLPKK